MNLPPIPIDNNFIPKKRACYTPDTLPAAITFAFVKFVITFTTPYGYQQVSVITSGAPEAHHIITRNKPVHETDKQDTDIGNIM